MCYRATAFLVLLPCLSLAGSASASPRQFGVPALSRDEFNRLAVLGNCSLYWIADRNKNKLVDPDEIAAVGRGKTLAGYLTAGQFSPRFISEYKRLVEIRRQEAVAKELDAGRPTLIASDFAKASRHDKVLLGYILDAAWIIEELYLHQTGGFRYWRSTGKLDPASKALFWRNHGPWCVTPVTHGDPFCNASAEFPAKRSESYPLNLTQDEAMCKTLQAHPNAKDLLDPFTVVEQRNGQWVAIPLHKVFGKKMKAIATRLGLAAAIIKKDEQEQAFYRYLMAAAQGFTTNDWAAADEAWVAMSSQNSKWYLRIAPDEVYYDPCQQKAGFHVSFGTIDKDSLAWQKKLMPLRAEMEKSIAQLLGPTYKARPVNFQMPDFVKIVLNAGDSRAPLGATIGQSLPNWGKVSQEGRGRTVVMSNFYMDEDSQRINRLKAGSLLDQAAMKYYTKESGPFLLNIILHEATHNFGPHSDFRIKGRPAKEIFGGELASTLEELKAQTGGLWYLQFLRHKGLINDRFLKQAYTNAIVWAFGHISQGMFTPTGNPRPYSQLAAIQLGHFSEEGVMRFDGKKFSINYDKLSGAIERLLIKVGRIKAAGDVNGGRKLVDYYVKGKGNKLVHQRTIAQRILRYPKASFVYSVTY